MSRESRHRLPNIRHLCNFLCATDNYPDPLLADLPGGTQKNPPQARQCDSTCSPTRSSVPRTLRTWPLSMDLPRWVQPQTKAKERKQLGIQEEKQSEPRLLAIITGVCRMLVAILCHGSADVSVSHTGSRCQTVFSILVAWLREFHPESLTWHIFSP
ncbi:hypothetical protein CEXT_723111 [Caerostris extrusa]|uniref:Uncharacterized protein n=1 Tax=Caerostris extrusa TaxID=172846 RepID=A0AAV4V650_CAEEX|nr:hypothetical protein CEXT_723111 [Caerostris extrusa]